MRRPLGLVCEFIREHPGRPQYHENQKEKTPTDPEQDEVFGEPNCIGPRFCVILIGVGPEADVNVRRCSPD